VKKAKAKGEKLTPKEKRELSKEEKEYRFKRKLIQEKLIKLATRIPIFMYLTDFREYCLKDVITQLEPGLFKRVTGLNVKDFELLVSLGVFNAALMNDAVYKFKRYEDSSLSYTGIDKHEGEAVGGYDTVLTRGEFERLYGSQQDSLTAVTQIFDDLPNVDIDFDDEDEDDIAKDTASEIPKSKMKPFVEKPYQQMKPDPFQKVAEAPIAPVPEKQLEPKKPAIDLSGVKAGVTLIHKSFGEGKVVKIVDDKIIVAFGKAEKMFLFPGAFENGFLRMEK